MTNSDQNISKDLDSVEETFPQEISIQEHISKQVNKLFEAKQADDFIFNQEIEDIDELADELFDALHDHTNK